MGTPLHVQHLFGRVARIVALVGHHVEPVVARGHVGVVGDAARAHIGPLVVEVLHPVFELRALRRAQADGRVVDFEFASPRTNAQQLTKGQCHIVRQHALDQHRRRAAAVRQVRLDAYRALGAGEPQVARSGERSRRLHAAIHLIGAQPLGRAVDAHRQLAGRLCGRLLQIAPRHRGNPARPTHPQVAAAVFGEELDLIAG